jgi:fatty-acyl-CoA synthase
MAWVKIKKDRTISGNDLIDFCRKQIAHYKIPKYWKFVDGFPMTITGKVRKVEMRETSIKELGLQEVAKIRTS